jgi:hypothetical protein
MGGKSRKSGGVSKALIAKLKSGNYKPPTKKYDTTEDTFKGLFDEEQDDRD